MYTYHKQTSKLDDNFTNKMMFSLSVKVLVLIVSIQSCTASVPPTVSNEQCNCTILSGLAYSECKSVLGCSDGTSNKIKKYNPMKFYYNGKEDQQDPICVNADCSGKPDGVSCFDTTSILQCPEGNVYKCGDLSSLEPYCENGHCRKALACSGISNGLSCVDILNVLVCPEGDIYPCEIMRPSKPYCNNGHCHMDPSSPAESTSPVLESCPRIGRYPDPQNCGVFHQCSKVGDKAAKYGCPFQTRYDPVKELCYKPNISSPCYTFGPHELCRDSLHETIVHPQRQDVYATCNGHYELQVR